MRLLRTLLVGLYLLLAGVVLGAAAYVWGLRCEGFGCTGVGIAWGLWGSLCGLAVALGPILRSFLTQQPVLHKAVGRAWGLQAVLGLALLVYWFLKQGIQVI